MLAPDWSSRTSSSYGWLYLFQGGRYDGATGNYHFDAREYRPTIGQWLERNPLGFAAGDLNIGRFVGDNPTDGLDPSGLKILLYVHVTKRSGWAEQGGHITIYWTDENGNYATFDGGGGFTSGTPSDPQPYVRTGDGKHRHPSDFKDLGENPNPDALEKALGSITIPARPRTVRKTMRRLAIIGKW